MADVNFEHRFVKVLTGVPGWLGGSEGGWEPGWDPLPATLSSVGLTVVGEGDGLGMKSLSGMYII